MRLRHWLLAGFALLVLVGGCVALWLIFFRPERFDFDKLGGTILVYEVEPTPNAGDDIANLMAESLERRLDPDGRGAATVRAVARNQVEIRLTRVKPDHAATVLEAKQLIAQGGILEFRILANEHDDKEAIARAKELLNDAGDPDTAAQKRKWQTEGLPPAGPRLPRRDEPERFTIKLARGEKSTVSYSWVELGAEELRSLDLDLAARDDPARNKAWLECEAKRDRALQLKYAEGPADFLMLQGALFYSRECKDRNLTEQQQRTKAIEYFVLARDPEFEKPDGPVRVPKLDGSYLTSAQSKRGQDERPVIAFTFNPAGAELFRTLTRKNVRQEVGPEGDPIRRHLAILLDGQVLSAPTINSEIGAQGQISANWTQEKADRIVNLLRAGAMPGRLKIQPIRETEVAPVK